MLKAVILFTIAAVGFSSAFAQNSQKSVNDDHCGTMQRLEMQFAKDPVLRKQYEASQRAFSAALSNSKGLRAEITPVTIPVVFHIVLTNPNLVTDAMIRAQVDTLNKDFGGYNGDSTRIPSYFKPLFGKAAIQFCLAQRSPDGDLTTGIERYVTTSTSFTFDDKVKHASEGGVNSWNTSKYLNIWVTVLSNGLLGYATFPNSAVAADQGVVIEYRSLPGGAYTNYNQGKTLTHETGHYFNLLHIWGDDKGACTGTDEIAQTPNQADATAGFPIGIKTDSCTPGGNGIMYQNYMDYSDDPALVLFTKEQVTRMETAFSLYRNSFYTSDGCTPVTPTTYNAQIRAINFPLQRICTPTFAPVVTFRNKGQQTLTSLRVSAQLDNGTPVSLQFTGSLATAATAVVTLPSLNSLEGQHILRVYTSLPNGQNDEEKLNDTLTLRVQYNTPVGAVAEGFENSTFPPSGWDIVNYDGYITWERAVGVAKTGSASVMINNADYDRIGQRDDLRMPNVTINSLVDSAFLSFQVAAATYTPIGTANNIWDTLEVLVSKDCGVSYTSVYKKWAGSLVTHTQPVLTGFTPTASEWRKDSISLQNFIGAGTLLITIRNTTGFENNIYLDDINLRTVIINPNLKAQGFLVTPNPVTSNVVVQFFPQPTKLKSIEIYSSTGQLVRRESVGNTAPANLYQFNLDGLASGVYTVRAVFTDRVIQKRVIKVRS